MHKHHLGREIGCATVEGTGRLEAHFEVDHRAAVHDQARARRLRCLRPTLQPCPPGLERAAGDRRENCGAPEGDLRRRRARKLQSGFLAGHPVWFSLVSNLLLQEVRRRSFDRRVWHPSERRDQGFRGVGFRALSGHAPRLWPCAAFGSTTGPGVRISVQGSSFVNTVCQETDTRSPA